jgi:DNA (cytosine-5)-methyltransferase 1
MLTVGSLFAGVGGIELGLERTGGFRTVWQVEIDDYAQRVLAKHWPDVRRWTDVRTFPPEPIADWQCDLICGGDPCQANSAAGKSVRESLGGEFLRVVDAIRPRLVLRENPSHVRRDAPWPWWRMRSGLESLGYAVLPFRLRACCLGAEHRRERLFLLAELADADGNRLEGRTRPATGVAAMEPAGLVAKADWPPIPASGGLDSRAGIPGYVDQVRCLGNAVVPQVAEWIGRRILAAISPPPNRTP